MKARTFRVLAIVLVAACGTGEVTQPVRPIGTNPLAAIQDGANGGGNSDFFFLPPMVDNPAGNPDFLNNGLNTSLIPTVTITTGSTTLVDAAPAPFSVDHYQLDWQVPVSTASTTYRVTIHLGDEPLGYADVYAAANSADLKTAADDVVALKDGRTLPIKFVIENCALVVGECASKTVNISQGGTVATEEGGVSFPAQPNGQTVRVQVEGCPDIPTDLPIKSECLRVTTDPPLSQPLTLPATVWVCTGPAASPGSQEERITMYRFDGPSTTTALPHADDQCLPPPPSISESGTSLRGVLADLVRGRFRSAGRQFATLVGPRVLYATTLLDVGAGGFTEDFSDFQLVLPGSMTKCSPWQDGQVTNLNTTLAYSPTVCVNDVEGDPVQGATVHFATTGGSLSAMSAVTDINGKASVSWTLQTLGLNTMTASGNGIGGSDNNGPRATQDPFQPLSGHFGDGSNGPAVPVLTGSETFSATASTLPYGSSGYTYLLNVVGDGHTTWYGTPRPAVPGGSAVPASWYSPSFTPTGWTANGVAAFGTPGTGTCSINGNVQTTWAIDTDILVRKTFATSAAGTLTIDVRIDNDVQVWLDGVNVTASASTTSGGNHVELGGAGTDDDWFVHGGCADAGNPVFSTSVGAGSHVLALRGADYGSISHLDVRVTFIPTP